MHSRRWIRYFRLMLRHLMTMMTSDTSSMPDRFSFEIFLASSEYILNQLTLSIEY